jgi:hypothetical protein
VLVDACGRGSPAALEPPVARPFAALSPAAPQAGSPISVAYRWSVPASGLPLTGRHRAFVHFLDREGALLFTDDHVPSPPPDAWQPGASYAYRRIVLTPAFPYSGVVTVAMGLYAEESGARAQLGGDEMGQRRVRVAQFHLRPRDRDLPVRCEGLYEPEAALAAPLAVWRFLGREAACSFANPHEDVVLFLRADLDPRAYAAPPRLTITSTTRRDAARWYEAEIPLRQEAVIVTARVPARLLGKAADAGFMLAVDGAFLPGPLDARDPRVRTLRLFGIYAARAQALPPELRGEQGAQ